MLTAVSLELASSGTTAVAAVIEILHFEETRFSSMLTAVSRVALEGESSGTVAVVDMKGDSDGTWRYGQASQVL